MIRRSAEQASRRYAPQGSPACERHGLIYPRSCGIRAFLIHQSEGDFNLEPKPNWLLCTGWFYPPPLYPPRRHCFLGMTMPWEPLTGGRGSFLEGYREWVDESAYIMAVIRNSGRQLVTRRSRLLTPSQAVVPPAIPPKALPLPLLE